MESVLVSPRHSADRAGQPPGPPDPNPGSPLPPCEGKSNRPGWGASILLLAALAALGTGLATWKVRAIQEANAQAAQQPEPVEVVGTAVAEMREHRRTTTAIGTVLALRSTTLRNELPGTVAVVALAPGRIVEAGTLLVALDTSVEEAELKALEAEAALAETVANRTERAVESRATSRLALDRAQADLEVARARIARLQAVIARKTIRAPFRARLGISDVHPGQYLEVGTALTTLQGVDAAVHVDFAVPQHVAHRLGEGEFVEVLPGPEGSVVSARIVAVDAKVDPRTRNTTVRARVDEAGAIPSPGASVRVRVPDGDPVVAVVIPANALRKGPGGDHVFVIVADAEGQTRAQMRRVTAGAGLSDEVLVISGLTAGDRVAAFGSFKLREGARVALAGATDRGAAAN